MESYWSETSANGITAVCKGCSAVIFATAKKELGVVVIVEQRVQVKPRRFRVPDIIVLAKRPAGPIVQEPPLLCIEILSPRDLMQEMQERIDDYLDFGVLVVWVIHPGTLRAFIYTPEGSHEAKDGILRAENPEIRVSLSDLRGL